MAAHLRLGVGAIDPHETSRIVARDLAPVVSVLASLKGEVYRDLGSRPEHRALAHRLEAAHAAAEAALVEARRRARLDGE